MAQQTFSNLDQLFNVRTLINANATDAESRLSALEPSGPTNGLLRKGSSGQIEGFAGLTLGVTGSDYAIGAGEVGGSVAFDFKGYTSTLYKDETDTLMARLYRDGANFRLDESAGYTLRINNVHLSATGPGTNFLADDGSYKPFGGAATDEKVKASPADTTPGFLTEKLGTSPGLSFALENPGANEKFQFLNMAGAAARQWNFDASSTAAGDPGGGNFRMNNVNQGSVTQLFMSKNALPEGIMTSLLGAMKTGDRIIAESTNGLKYKMYVLTGNVVDATSHMVIPVSVEFASGSDIVDADPVSFGLYLTRPTITSAGSARYIQTADGSGGFSADINAQTFHDSNLAEMRMQVPTLSGVFAGYMVNDSSGALALSLGYLESSTRPRLLSGNTFQLNTVGFPTGVAIAYTLPAADGAADTYLKTDGSGAMSFKDPSSEPIKVRTASGGSTLQLDDQGKTVDCTSGSSNTQTVPTNAAVAFPIGTVIYVTQLGAGLVTIAGSGGVTINVHSGTLALAGQFATIMLRKTATDTWLMTGENGV
jgi:hypothetical protein